MKDIIETLYPMNRNLLGEGFDSALEYINHLIPLEVASTKSGTKLGTWTVPDEWIVRDAWVKYKGKKIFNYKKEPLSLVVYSKPFNGKVKLDKLKKHVFFDADRNSTPYIFKFYEQDWGFTSIEEEVAKLKKGEYEVFIDTGFKKGELKYGVHTIPGKIDREILLFAHLDHPFQANDNLSGVACLIDSVKKIKSDRTIKIIFCAETIGSIQYAHIENLSNVDFVLAIDICGNDNSMMLQKAFDRGNRINSVSHCALQMAGIQYRKGEFRNSIGSDETVFNDPHFNIPGILLSTYPYDEYHTKDDTPDKINYKKIKETQELMISIIRTWDKDFIPVRTVSGPLMRSRYGIQSASGQVNLNLDYFWYSIDGKKSLAELCADFELNFDYMYDLLVKIEKDGFIMRAHLGEVGQ